MLSLGLFVLGLFVGVGLGYGFRGKEHAALAAAGAEVKAIEDKVESKL